jgi:hypothetical protein
MTTFPQVPLDARVELKLGATWTQIQGSPTGVRGADNIKIVRGRTDEQQQSSQQPSTCDMSLNNRDGRYSPRNPNSPYYGQLGRNTPIRVSTPGDGSISCRVPGTYGVDNVTTPDSSALHLTGDLDIRADLTLDNWAQYQTIAQRWRNGGTASSWIFYLGTSGQLRFAWSLTGKDVNFGTDYQVFSCSQNIAAAPKTELAVRVTLSVSTGQVVFYTAPTIAGPWTQLGATTGTGAATTLFAGTEPLMLGETGQARTLNTSIMAGRINTFQLLSGIGGTAVANPVFTSQALGTTSFTDAAGRTWTLNGDCEITNRRYRFYGEVSSFPPKWDVSGNDVYVPIEAAGILRRYGQGTLPVASPIRQAVLGSKTQPIIYWPCEDPAGSTSFTVGGGTGQPMTITGSPTLATDTHIGGSAPLPSLSNSMWNGTIPSYTPSNPVFTAVTFVIYLPTAPATGTVIARLIVGTTRMDLAWSNSGSVGFYINTFDVASGTMIDGDNSGTPMPATTATPYAVQIQAFYSSGQFNTAFSYQWPTGSNYFSQGASGDVGRAVGQMSKFTVNPNGTLSDTVVGHISCYNTFSGSYPQFSSFTGNAGETAGSRFVRLCFENGIQPRVMGDVTNSPPMGSQGVDSLLNLLQSCIDADDGMLYEPRDVLGLGMRMRSSLFSQAPQATLSHSASQLSAVPEPVDDDQLIRNDVTVTRTNGSFARATLTTGTLSVQAPPNGVGIYSDTPTINFNADSQLLDEASWRMHTGTVDESRWPLITTGMHTYEMVNNQTLALAVQSVDVGDVITITGMPSWLPPDDTYQLVQGIQETLSNYTFEIAFNCSPASPYDVIVLDDGTFARLDTDGSTLHTSVGTGDTTFLVDTTNAGSPLWTTSAGDFPFDIKIDGERVTVTNVTGSSSPQTFTVTRSVNGIVKAHSAGASISLFRPFYLGV